MAFLGTNLLFRSWFSKIWAPKFRSVSSWCSLAAKFFWNPSSKDVWAKKQSIVVYLKLGPPEARKNLTRNRFEKYRCVPKIAWPEARNKYSVKCLTRYRCVPKIASPEARKNLSRKNDHFKVQSSFLSLSSSPVLFLNSGLFILAYALVTLTRAKKLTRYRCVPKIASPEARKNW